MADNSNTIEFPIRVPGAQEAAQAIGGVAVAFKNANQSIDGTQKAAKEASNSLRLVVDNTKQTSQSLQQVSASAKQSDDAFTGMARTSARSAAALNIVGGELAHLNPELATMVQAVGRSSGAISGFSSVVGGPWALAIGAVVAGVGLWIDSTRREAEEQQKLEEAIQKTNAALEEQVKAARSIVYKGAGEGINAQLAQQRGALADLQKAPLVDAAGKPVVDSKGNPLGGTVMTAEKQRAIDDLKSAIKTLEDQQKQADNAEREANERKKFWEQQQRAASLLGSPNAATQKAALAAKSYLASHDEEGNLTTKPGDGSTAAGRTEYRRETETGTKLGEQDETLKRQLAAAQEFQKQQQQLYQQGAAAKREIQARELDDEFKQQDKLRALRKLGIDDEVAAHKDKEPQIIALAEYRARKESALDADRKKEVEAYTQIGVQAFAAFGSAGINAFMQLAEGQKVSGKAVVRQIGETLVAQGTGYLFQGLAETILGHPMGPSLMGIGTAEIAAGITMGAASRGAGGSRGSASPVAPGGATYWNGDRFERGSPYAPVPANTNNGGPVNIYQTVQLSSVIAPTADDAVRIERAMQEGERLGRVRRRSV